MGLNPAEWPAERIRALSMEEYKELRWELMEMAARVRLEELQERLVEPEERDRLELREALRRAQEEDGELEEGGEVEEPGEVGGDQSASDGAVAE